MKTVCLKKHKKSWSHLELEPNNIELLNSLGIVYRGINEPEKAIEFYRKVLDLDDGDPVTLLNISIVQAEHLKNYPEAIATIEEYLKKGKREKNYFTMEKKSIKPHLMNKKRREKKKNCERLF